MRKTVWIFLLVAYFILLAWVSHVRAPASNVMEADEEVVNYLSRMVCSDETMRNEDGSVTVSEGKTLFGPYLDLEQGNYLASIETDRDTPFEVVVTADSGETMLAEVWLNRSVAVFPLPLESNQNQVEFVLRGDETKMCVTAVYLTQVEEIPSDIPQIVPESALDETEDASVDYTGLMNVSREGMRQGASIVLEQDGDVMFGPYITVEAGEYCLCVDLSCDTEVVLAVTANSGELFLREKWLTDGLNTIPLHFDEEVQALEFVIHSISGEKIVVKQLSFFPAGTAAE